VNVIALQHDIAWENKEANFARVHKLLTAAAPIKGALIALPEMFATGFSMNADAIAEPPGGATEQFLAAMAREFDVCVVAGLAIRGRDGRVRNRALALSPAGDRLAAYAKMRLFTPGGEPDHYAAGRRSVAFRWGGCTISPFICYDLRFPEIFRRATAVHRSELSVVIANFPKKRIHHWARLLQARAIENQAYVVGVNRVGRDPYYTYAGRSLIIDPQGETLAEAAEREGCVRARLDLVSLRQYREGLPFLEDMARQ
jgi:predicted amidohydrolase